MSHLTPQIIAEVTGGEYIGNDRARDIRVIGAERDNRDVKPGNLFVCIKGERVDGHSFANNAFASGAACCLAERIIPDTAGPYVLVGSTLEAIKKLGAYYRSLFNIPVIGITGSVGKTTAKELIAATLGAKLRVLKTPKNLNNELGVPLTLLSLDEYHEAAVIEMGISDFGEMRRLAQMVRPDIFVITKIGYSHIKELGDLKGVLTAKSEAFAFMKPDGIAILNGDDDMLRKYDPGMRGITFGLDKHNDFRAENISAEGTSAVSCDITSAAGRFRVKIPAYGSHLASLAPLAAAAGRLLGLTDIEISNGLLSYVPVTGRSNVSDTGTITLINDCYNANPHSVTAALKSLSTLPSRRVAILGDMLGLGEQADRLHRETGDFAAQSCNNIDILICCGDMARLIYDNYNRYGSGKAYFYPAKADLIADLPGLLNKGDTVLVKASRAMRFEEITNYLERFVIPSTLCSAE
jgi:UDP-N-acetylmuramoyl-tripeptide--D-alanyl-D-alanine ligase